MWAIKSTGSSFENRFANPLNDLDNSVEILPAVYFTFPKYSGLYFWSVLASNFGVLLYSTGFGMLHEQISFLHALC